MMNVSFTERSEAPELSLDRSHLAVSDHTKQHHQYPRFASQSPYPQHPSASHQQDVAAVYQSPMHQTLHQSKPHSQRHHDQHQSNHHYLQQQQPQSEHQPPPQRAAGQSFSVPRTISTPSWISSSNPALHLHSAPSNIGAAVPLAPSSSSSSGSLLSYWDQTANSDSELNMTSAMPASNPQHTMSEMGHHRYPSSAASLPAISPSGVVSYPSPSHISSCASPHGYMAAGSDHYHPYRASSMSMGSGMSTQYAYHSTHQPAPSGGIAYSSSVPAQLTSSGLVYAPSASSAPVGAGPGYDSYPPQFSAHSQYVSYLPPALSHDSRFFPLNPFEIKHRRRTTKTQFRVLESTFREIPKPNAALRKQISAQLDMPVRAVQIWFQNRRAKAKAMEKKRQTGEGSADAAQERHSTASGGVASHHFHNDAGERRSQASQVAMYPATQVEQSRSHLAHYDDGAKSISRSVDLPPLRIQADQMRPDNYSLASPAVTLPSINAEAGPLRDRRPVASSPISHASGSTANPTYGLGFTSVQGENQEHADEHGSVRSAVAHAPPAPGNTSTLSHLQNATVDHTHAAQTGSSSFSTAMSTAADRPNRMSSLPSYATREALPLPSSSPRQFGHESSRFWSASQQ